ncbi:MAG: ACT domain-containing protein [Oscillospiraceae bacterium]|jgi:ACT domain-containing protein|nr:ACT domain-containing protein [Oscillospiraceae bacterium]
MDDNITAGLYSSRRRDSAAVVTVLGRDRKGIIAKVSAALYEHGANILDLSQTVLDDMFNMVMLVDIGDTDFNAVQTRLEALGRDIGQQIRIQRGEIFDAMHRV